MDAFPVSPELMQAFPLGALSLLVTVASTVAAQHGVERARTICGELARNDELWRFIAHRVERQPGLVDRGEAETRGELGLSPNNAESRERPTSENAAAGISADQNDAIRSDVAFPAEFEPPEPTTLRDCPPRARPSKSKRRRRQKSNGAQR
jgi:hypothetical protein